MKKIFKTVFYGIVILILIVMTLLKFNIPVFGYKCYVVMSGSMEPTIGVDDMIFIKKDKTYNVGDIVTYREDDYYVTHRIVEIDGDKIITKGDSNNTNDTPISVDDIEGKYVGKIPKFNYYLSMIYKPISLIIIFFVGIIITIFIKE